MAESNEDDLKKKEFELKLVQAWTDTRYKVATVFLLGNGAAVATALTYIKDKGFDEPSVNALRSSLGGITAAVVALLIVWAVSEHLLAVLSKKSHADYTTSQSRAQKYTGIVFLVMILISGLYFTHGSAFYEGWAQGTVDHLSKKRG
jgi:hypothetical protein